MNRAAAEVTAPRFVRRTSLNESEYHRNFRKLDGETISLLTSSQASKITSQMCKVYLSLVNLPPDYLEREGVLRFAGCEKEGEWQTAWEQLVSLLGVASATARKALQWMSEKGIIGYYAGRNGVGIRIFLNRASSSIGHRDAPAQKNLRLVRASSGAPHTSPADTPFKDSFADLEASDTDLNRRAPKNGADEDDVDKISSTRQPGIVEAPRRAISPTPQTTATDVRPASPPVSVDEIVRRLRFELEPGLLTAARQAAASEHQRTREWLESRGLPKAARVAQRETYNVLRQHGVISAANERARAELAVGRQDDSPPVPKELTPDEVREMAEICVAMLETRGQAIDVTLSEMSTEAGGFLLPSDAPKVRELAEAMTVAHKQVE